MKVEITRHAEQRMRERCGLNKKSIERMANKAWKNGIRHYETIGNLNKWVTMVYFRRKCACDGFADSSQACKRYGLHD